MILASRPTYRTSSERGQRRASSGDDNDDDKYAHKYTNTQIQRQIQDRKGLSAEKAIHVAYFRNSESARISNMIFSVHHQTITQRQIQRQRQRQRQIQRQRQRQSIEKTIHVAYFRNAEGARVSNMIFSVHHHSIIQRQRQIQRQSQRQSAENTIHVAYF